MPCLRQTYDYLRSNQRTTCHVYPSFVIADEALSLRANIYIYTLQIPLHTKLFSNFLLLSSVVSHAFEIIFIAAIFQVYRL